MGSVTLGQEALGCVRKQARAEEMAQWLRALIALAEGPGVQFPELTLWISTIFNPYSREPNPSSGLCRNKACM